MRIKENISRVKIREILREVFFLVAIGAVFVMVPQRCGMTQEEIHANADKEKSQRTGEITLRDRNDKDGLSLWLRDLERGQGPGE